MWKLYVYSLSLGSNTLNWNFLRKENFENFFRDSVSVDRVKVVGAKIR